MPILHVVLLCAGLHHPGIQAADFRLDPHQGTDRPTSGPAVSTTGRSTIPFDAAPSTEPLRPTAKPQFKIATGYGHQIALDFAVRQIVPSGVSIFFGPGVDTAVLVDWQGGREWNKVLASTVAPLGDRIDVGHNKVTISLKKS